MYEPLEHHEGFLQYSAISAQLGFLASDIDNLIVASIPAKQQCEAVRRIVADMFRSKENRFSDLCYPTRDSRQECSTGVDTVEPVL